MLMTALECWLMPIGTWQKCYRCKSDMWVPQALEDAARATSRISLFCAYGHEQHYVEGDSEETKLRRERDRLAQQIAQKDDEIRHQQFLRDLADKRAQRSHKEVVRLKKRAAAGVCPCCNRSFGELAKHMATKHPDFRAEDAARENVVSIVKGKTA
jgi:hypothetical protein